MNNWPLLDPDTVAECMVVRSLPDQAYGIIRHAIVTGRFKPGQWLRQRDLAQEMGVSVPTTREALNRLASEGYLVAEPNKGFRTIMPTLDDLVDRSEVLLALEPRAFILAANSITPKELAKMREYLPAILAEPTENLAAWRKADHDFHDTVWQAAGRPFIRRVLEQAWAGILIGQLIHLYKEVDLREIKNQFGSTYPQMLEALETGDGKSASEACIRMWNSEIERKKNFFERIHQHQIDR